MTKLEFPQTTQNNAQLTLPTFEKRSSPVTLETILSKKELLHSIILKPAWTFYGGPTKRFSFLRQQSLLFKVNLFYR